MGVIESTALSDELVETIVKERKFIDDDLRLDDLKLRNDEVHYRMKKDLICEEHKCIVKVRQAVLNPLNFSIILVYVDRFKTEHLLVRYNGNHGRHTNLLTQEKIDGPHIHRWTEDYFKKTDNPLGFAEKTSSYITLKDAVRMFIRDMNILKATDQSQMVLDDYNAH